MDSRRASGHGRSRSTPLPTLEDVARHAGVSTATVSRCLNTPERVVEDTRKRVLKAVTELGYAPNYGARILAARRSNTIGAIIPTMENAIFARGLQAFQEELGRQGVTMLVASSSYRQDIEEEQIRTLTARGADGLLLIGHDRTEAAYTYLARRGIPFLVAWAYDPEAPRLSVGFDNRAAMRALADRVLDLGHRRIAVISAPQAANDRARERVAGVLAAVAARGCDPGTVAVLETSYSIDNGEDAFRRLFVAEPHPTAVLCGNDVLAIGALRKAQDMGLSIPGDVSITGFDDIELARIATPRLTTVHVPHREMGRTAAEILVALINGAPPPESLRLETAIVLRDTLGPPRGD